MIFAFVFLRFCSRVFVWCVPHSWNNNFFNIPRFVPYCLYRVVIGNFRCVPCSVDNRLSGCWRAFPCCFHTSSYDVIWESQRSLYNIFFVQPGFVLCSLHDIFCARPDNPLVIPWRLIGAIHLCGVLQIMTKTQESHTLIRVPWLLQASTSSFTTSSSSLSSGSNFFCISLFKRNICFATANSAASSKSETSSSINRRRDFTTLRCNASCLIRWVHFRRSK